jgi:signal transduction histidine kinase
LTPGPARGIFGLVADLSDDALVDLATAGRLAAGLAHDLRHLLVAVGLNLEVMSRRAGDELDRRRATSLITAIDDAVDLLARFGEVARPATVGPPTPGDATAVDGAVEALTALLGPCLGVIELHVHLATPDARVAVTATELRRCLLNLALNAIEALGGSGRLAISTRLVELTGTEGELRPPGRTGRFVVLEVADDGPGVDVDAVRAGTSTGLGLANTLAVATAAGGALGVTSTAGSGSSFCVYLPVHG